MTEKTFAFVFDSGIGDMIRGTEAESLEKGLISKDSLESRSGILDESVEDGERAKLAMHIAILPVPLSTQCDARGTETSQRGDGQLFADRSGGFGGAATLYPYHLNEINDAGEIILIILFARQILDLDRDSREGFLLRLSLERPGLRALGQAYIAAEHGARCSARKLSERDGLNFPRPPCLLGLISRML